MNAYPRETALAAKWLYDRKEVSIDWNYRVLSEENPDKEGLKYSRIKAYQIFTILEHEGLLEPFEFVDKYGGRHIEHRLVLADYKKWKAIQNPPGKFKLYIINPIFSIFSNTTTFLFWLGSVIITVLVERFLGK